MILKFVYCMVLCACVQTWQISIQKGYNSRSQYRSKEDPSGDSGDRSASNTHGYHRIVFFLAGFTFVLLDTLTYSFNLCADYYRKNILKRVLTVHERLIIICP